MRSKPLQALLLAAALSFGWTLPSFTEAAPQRSSPPGVKIRSIGTILITVGDMDRSLDFYSRVLTFEKVSDTELAGGDVEHLFGVFGARVRVVRMKLGDEYVELVQFLAPRGRSIPADSRSNDLWFQHIAVIVSNMDRAYQVLRQNKVEHASSGPQRLPDWNKNAGGIKAFYFKDPDEHPVEILEFPEGKGDPKWHQPSDRLFLGITTPPSWSLIPMLASSSIAICSACESRERAKTMAPSRNISTTSSAPVCELPRYAHPPARESNCWNT